MCRDILVFCFFLKKWFPLLVSWGVGLKDLGLGLSAQGSGLEGVGVRAFRVCGQGIVKVLEGG